MPQAATSWAQHMALTAHDAGGADQAAACMESMLHTHSMHAYAVQFIKTFS